MIKVVTFGELMMRLSPPGLERFLQSPSFVATFGGSEANVAVSLAHFGLDSWYVTRLPNQALGDAALRALRAEGVRTDAIVRGGSRLGLYFAETGASQRASTVIYDRARSAMTEIGAEDVDWPAVLEGAAWFHVSGVTPALGSKAADATRAAIDKANERGARVSIDLNFRRKLWSPAEAQTVMRPLIQGIDLVVANEEDLQNVLGISVEDARVAQGEVPASAYRVAAERVSREFGVRRVAITLRESRSADENGWSAVMWEAADRRYHTSPKHALRVVDRIGAGDSFAAGLIYGLVTDRTPEAALAFAVAASALKHSVPGDFNRVTTEEVNRLAAGDGSGRVQR